MNPLQPSFFIASNCSLSMMNPSAINRDYFFSFLFCPTKIRKLNCLKRPQFCETARFLRLKTSKKLSWQVFFVHIEMFCFLLPSFFLPVFTKQQKIHYKIKHRISPFQVNTSVFQTSFST